MANYKKRAELRKEMRTVVSQLDARWVQAAGRDLCGRLEALIEQEAQRRPITHILAMAAYFPGEVDLAAFIARALGTRAIYLPRVIGDRKMQFIRIDENWSAEVESGSFGIPEPPLEGGEAYDIAHADETVVIVPGLAFDPHGNRLGRGKGYYNAFLQPPMTRALLIGIGWELQRVQEVPSDTDRAAMEWLCTERGVYRISLSK